MYYEKVKSWELLFSMALMIPFLNLIVNTYLKNLYKDILETRMYRWLVSKRDMITVSDSDFEMWCANFIKRMGYRKLKITSERRNGKKDIVCSKDNEKVYIICRRNCVQGFFDEESDSDSAYSPVKKKKANYDLSDINLDDDSSFGKIGRPFIQEFVGLMHHDNIKKGLILTTGYFSKEAIDYVSTLPEDYKIELIDGDNLMLKHWQLLKNII